jgi:hypothetical protein
MDFEIVASRVVLLNDGLMVLVTVPNEYYQIVMSERKSVEIRAIPEPGMVFVKVGKVIIKLPSKVFEHVVETGRIFVYLSDYDNYLMEPWVEGTINAAELWTVKGVADYLATQTTSDSTMKSIVRQVPENGVVAMAAAPEFR